MTEQKTSNPFDGIDVPIQHHGSAITLPQSPARMSIALGIETLQRKQAEDEQTININEQIDAFPLDGAVAFQKAMQRTFGWVTAVPTPSFFGSKPPQTREVPIGPNETMSVVWSRFELPGVEGYLSCDTTNTSKGPRFVISGMIKRKDHEIVRTLAKLTRDIAQNESIYRAKAISLQVDDDGDVMWDSGISFVDLSGIDPKELVFSAMTETQISTSLWTPIENTEMCRKHRIPLKRGILLEGKYGTGKTLTSGVTAIKAVANGWTFLTINRVTGLKDALHFARKFQPCVIFAEDIDRCMEGGERTEEIDDILNTIDGVESKGTEIFVVLTTNHIENMNRAMLRPGRLDAIVSVTPPDAAAVKRLIALYGQTMLAQGATFDKTAEKLSGQIPAMIREAVERSKLYAINRHGVEGISGPLQVTDDDLYAAAVGLADHQMLLDQPAVERSEPSLRGIVEEAIASGLANLLNASAVVQNEVVGTRRDVRGLTSLTRDAIISKQASDRDAVQAFGQLLQAAGRR